MSDKTQEPRPEKRKRSRGDGLPNPPGNFVDLIGIVITVVQKYGARPDGLSVADLEKIKQDQSTEKTADESASALFHARHARFRTAQAARLTAVEDEVDSLRAKYKRNHEVKAALKPVKFHRNKKASHGPSKAQENGSEKPVSPAPETPTPPTTPAPK